MPMYSACGNAALPALGFPIRESTDHRLFSAYPWLIAAVHALHRLLVPRHPPCALLILTVITRSTRRRARGDTRYIGKTVQFSRSAEAPSRTGGPPDGCAPTGSRPVSQNSTACCPAPARGRCARPGLGPVDIARSRWLGRRGMRRSGTEGPEGPPRARRGELETTAPILGLP